MANAGSTVETGATMLCDLMNLIQVVSSAIQELVGGPWQADCELMWGLGSVPE